MRTSLSLALGLAATAVLAMPAHAQNSGSINATADVQASIAVTGTDLEFGNIAIGQTKTVSPAAANAGTFTVAGVSSAPVVLSFTAIPGDAGAATLPLTSWLKRNSATNDAGAAPESAMTGATFTGTLNSSGNYYVWVGATLEAQTGAPTGPATSSPITLEVLYQ
jgi:hypothetical protein